MQAAGMFEQPRVFVVESVAEASGIDADDDLVVGSEFA
jgi:hypothetical protein